jgi:lysozyme
MAKKKPPLTLSEAGLEFVARFEGFRAHPYNDAAAPPNATIGYGHMLHRGPVTKTDLNRYPHGITVKAGLALLRADAATAVSAVRRSVKVKLTQAQFDALVSFTFNCGGGALASSQLLRDLNAGHYHAVPGDLMHWTHAGSVELAGLVTRRRAEAVAFV